MPTKAGRGLWISWSCSYWWLWADVCECWDPKTKSCVKVAVLMITEPPLQSTENELFNLIGEEEGMLRIKLRVCVCMLCKYSITDLHSQSFLSHTFTVMCFLYLYISAFLFSKTVCTLFTNTSVLPVYTCLYSDANWVPQNCLH